MSVCVTTLRDPLHYATLPRWPPERVEELEARSLSKAIDVILTTDAIEKVIKHPGGTP